MQKSPKVAMLEVMAKATHHQRGAGCSTTPEIRSVSQLKFRLFRTSGGRASGVSSEADASLPITSGVVDAPSIFKLILSHAFSSVLATPIFAASGIFGLGLR